VTGPPTRSPEWCDLARLTPARIALARAGPAPTTAETLAFALAHARARDAVHTVLDGAALARDLAFLGKPALMVASAAVDRATYLRRPDLGRRLSDAGAALLAGRSGGADLALVLADGLSARAVQAHAPPLLRVLVPRLTAAGLSLAPPVIATQARVALGDQVARLLAASAVAILIGERPGLSAPDSLGVYLTWAPGPTTTDADRNCVSNIRPEGLAPEAGAERLAWLILEARRRGQTGVALKDESDGPLALD
jgi:ethanolamine ammonia-lyase small subunit